MLFALHHVTISKPYALGSQVAIADMSSISRLFTQPSRPETLINLDFDGVTHTNGSYLRASLLWLLMCGRAEHAGAAAAGNEAWTIKPFPVFPIVTNCSPAVAEEIHDFVMQRGEAVLYVAKLQESGVQDAVILGTLDSFLAKCLEQLCALREATAQQLHEIANEPITVNAWSNRLLDLFTKRLVSRRRDGKFWVYSPIAQSHTLWA
jgi:hypothetical protein